MTLTLECLLNDTSSNFFQAFSVYLQQQYATENLNFWLAVQRYRKDYTTAMTNDSNGDTKSTPRTITQQCMEIIDTHVQYNACQEINIPCGMRHAILDNVLADGGHNCNYHPDLFIPACEAVLELMRSNSFVPWLGEWTPSMLPTPPLSYLESPTTSHHRASFLVSSLSSPDGWNVISASSSCLSISSFWSTNDIILPSCSSQQQQQPQQQQQLYHLQHPSRRLVGGLSYQTVLKRMKDRFFNSSFRTRNPTRRSSVTWPSIRHRNT